MNEKTNLGLVDWAREWLDSPYWYGTCCYRCTTSLLVSKSIQYPTHYTEARMPRYKSDVALGKRCADCIGLIKGYHWFDGENVKNGNFGIPDVNTTGLFNAAVVKGEIEKMNGQRMAPEVPGLIMYKSGHVGIYEGNGYVIEAKGFAYGILRSHIDDTDWKYWVVDPWISYAGYEEIIGMALPEEITYPCGAIVHTRVDPSINIWSNSRKSKSLGKVERGESLYVIEPDAAKAGWYYVKKDGLSGYADGAYLQLYNIAIEDIPEGIVDDAKDAEPPPLSEDCLYWAKVVNIMTRLNFRTSPNLSDSNTFDFLHPDELVEILAENQGPDGKFAKVRRGGDIGYCTQYYLAGLW